MPTTTPMTTARPSWRSSRRRSPARSRSRPPVRSRRTSPTSWPRSRLRSQPHGRTARREPNRRRRRQSPRGPRSPRGRRSRLGRRRRRTRRRPRASGAARPPDPRVVPGDQLDLPISIEPGQALPARLAPMQPSAGPEPFDDPAYLFEPWWPGVRALAWIEDRRLIRLQAEGMADALSAFAELAEELPERLTEDGVVLDGWLLALDEGGWLHTDLLRRRLAGERGAGRPGFVASDLLWCGGEPWHARRFATRRERLADVLR